MVNLFLSLLIGVLGVLQNTINKKISNGPGIPPILIWNGIALLSCSLIFFFVLRLLPPSSLPELFRQKTPATFAWKNLVPGFFGFVIIAIAPYVIERAGATRVFIGIIVAQIVASILWDYYVESVPVSVMRVAGAILAFAGACLAVGG